MQPFQFRHNGVAFPAAEFERGDFVLRRGATDEVMVGSSREGDTAIAVIPGSYDVHWRHVVGANVPANSDVPVVRGLRMNGALRVIDVPSIEVSGTFLVNGQPTPSPSSKTRSSAWSGRTVATRSCSARRDTAVS